MTTPYKPHCWFQPRFGLRTLFVAVTVFSLWFAWQVHVVRERHLIIDEIEKAGGRYVTAELGHSPKFEISWIRRLLGDHSIGLIVPIGSEPIDENRYQSAFPEALVLKKSKKTGGYHWPQDE